MKSVYIAGSALGVLPVLWILGAAKAGYFITDRHQYVPGSADAPISTFSERKKIIDVDGWRVAYIDEGIGPPVVLLHGCPFSSWEWKDVIPILSPHYRVIAPDLLGLGDTQVRLDDDYRLPNEMKMVTDLLDRLGISDSRFVGRDHGGATCELLMKYHPERIHSLVLTNIEAYDQWPSAPETPYLKLLMNPVSGPFFRLAFALEPVQREAYSSAVHAPDHLTDTMLTAFTAPQLSTSERYARLRRFFHWQLNRQHNLETMRALDAMQRFDRPLLILWGKHDTNFGPAISGRLAKDIPGVVRVERMNNSAHLPSAGRASSLSGGACQIFRRR